MRKQKYVISIQQSKGGNAPLYFETSETKAQKIIFGLRKTLDFESGGELAVNLDSLYDYCLRTLTRAHAYNDVSLFQEVRDIFQDLLDAWSKIGK